MIRSDILKSLSLRDFREWFGLPQDLDLAEVTKLFPPTEEWRGQGLLGQDRIETAYLNVPIPGYETEVRVWHADDRVLLMDVGSPELAHGLENLLSAIGPPNAKMDSYLGTLLLNESEWVYLHRGLTLYISSEGPDLYHLAVYAPATLNDYTNRLRLDFQRRRRPYVEF